MRNKKVVKKNKNTIIKTRYIPYVPPKKRCNLHEGYRTNPIKPIINNRFFKWGYAVFNTVLCAIIVYCSLLHKSELFVISLVLVSIALYKIASEKTYINKG